MDKQIAHFILTKVLLALWIVITSPIWLSCVWLAEGFEASSQTNVVGWAVRLVLLVYFLGLYWLSKNMAHHMTIEGLSFVKGVRAGFQDARFHLGFLPFVGHWFMQNNSKLDEDDAA